MLSSSAILQLTHLGFLQTPERFSPTRRRTQIPIASLFRNRRFTHVLKLYESDFLIDGFISRRNLLQRKTVNEDSVSISSPDDWELGETEGNTLGNSCISSSEGEDSDTELIINPIGDVDLPSIRENLESYDGTLTMTADRLAVLQRRRKANRIQPGVLINMGLITFLAMLLFLVDCCSWRIVRLPLAPFFLTRPFFISALVASFTGYLFVPLFDSLKMHQIFRKEGPVMHSAKKGTPTMGGLFFIPSGITVAGAIVGFSSIEVSGAAVATIAFAAIGLIDDILSFIKNHNYGLPSWVKVFLEVAVGTWFWFWLDSTKISSPYSMYTFL